MDIPLQLPEKFGDLPFRIEKVYCYVVSMGEGSPLPKMEDVEVMRGVCVCGVPSKDSIEPYWA